MSLLAGTVFAQNADNDALFAVIQRQLAGDSSTWSVRVPDKRNNNVFVSVREGPQDVVRREEEARTKTDDFKTSGWALGELLRKHALFNPKTAVGRALGDVIRQLTDDRFFEGDYWLVTDETTELGKIKDLYDQVVSRITTYDETRTGTDNTLTACLRDSAGVCRHMASILNESLKKAGINSEQMLSSDHHWVRVTLSDPAFDGITFDLDPTWYQQAIPLAPRDNSSMPIDWSNKMLAIMGSSGNLNVNGRWVTESGGIFEVSHAGNSLAGVLVKGYPGWIGKVIFSGELTDRSFSGTQLWRGKSNCPNFEMKKPATGTISADGNTITIVSVSPMYYPDTCTYAYDGEEETTLYTRQ